MPISDEVMALATAMQKKLDQNQHKPHWRGATMKYLYNRLNDEVRELKRGLDNEDNANIMEECADVANYAMMLYEKARTNVEVKP